MEPTTSLVEYGPRRVIITITAVFCATPEIIDTTIGHYRLLTGQCNYSAHDQLAVTAIRPPQLLAYLLSFKCRKRHRTYRDSMQLIEVNIKTK
jgi:hypothetical protein